MGLEKAYNFKKIESKTRDRIEILNIDDIVDAKSGKKIMFIEGPPTMNGSPHLGHLRGRVIKDLWYRYNTLCGNHVIFNGGWDTQGLPVELQAEKELGITGGKSEIINSVGLGKLVETCKSIVDKFSKEWIAADKLLGVSLDSDNAYWTHHDNYIQKEWQLLKQANQNNILYEDYTVIAYCPGCQTSLSHAEVNQGYEQIKDPSLYYKVKLQDSDEFFIVWTTMPFTLITDAMIGINPDETYHYISTNNEVWIVGETRLEDFAKEIDIEYTTQKTVKGSDLDGIKYVHPLLEFIPSLERLAHSDNYHISVSEGFVDVNTGTGLVHMSPANGEEDIKVANKRNVEIFCPIDDAVKFTQDAGKYSGLFVRDADSIIHEDLKSVGALVKYGTIKHKYPLCWRSGHPIVWLARKGWFYRLDRLENRAIDAANKVEYFFESPKNRFLGIIQERHPWCISRERFWGSPLPVWVCTECNHKMWFYSREEIVNAAFELPDGSDFELHRPWIDNVKIKCEKCNNDTIREPYVLDTWHNSGAAPRSSLTDEDYKNYIPAPFFTEGIDQTRGWAYTLLIENVIFHNDSISPYNSFLFQGHVLDKNGNKMSKSKGNVILASSILSEQSVDLLRLYLMGKTSPIEPLNFDKKEMMSRPYQLLNTLYNMHLFYTQNAQYDKYDCANPDSLNDIQYPDVWLLSKLQTLISLVTSNNEKCRFNDSIKSIDDFLIGSMSQGYIPMIRDHLWSEDDTQKQRRFTIYSVLGTTLHTLDILLHPICPFITEYLYNSVFGNVSSILSGQWPRPDTSLKNPSMEESFDIMMTIISVSASVRMIANLKRRWPLEKAYICVLPGKKSQLINLIELLKSQINIEEIEIFEISQSTGLELFITLQKQQLPVSCELLLNMARIGPKVKQHLSAVRELFKESQHDLIVSSLQKNNTYTFDVGGESITLDVDDFVINVIGDKQHAYSSKDDVSVIIPKVRNGEMITKGLIRDIARRLQSLRKERGFDPTDILSKASILDLDEKYVEMLHDKVDQLKYLVRVKDITFSDNCKEYKQEEIDGINLRISIE